MNDKAKIAFANSILALLGEEKANQQISHQLIGTLKKPFGINGFKVASVGNPVFEKSDRYFIFLESIDGKTVVEVPFYKEALAPNIIFDNALK